VHRGSRSLELLEEVTPEVVETVLSRPLGSFGQQGLGESESAAAFLARLQLDELDPGIRLDAHEEK
jgi:hypothetical protein